MYSCSFPDNSYDDHDDGYYHDDDNHDEEYDERPKRIIIIMPVNQGVAPLEAVVDIGPEDTVVVEDEMKWLIFVCKISPLVNKIR